MRRLNIGKLEELCGIHPFVREAQVYGTIEGTLTVEIEQREPVVRLLAGDGTSYFVDRDGFLVPDILKNPIHILHVNGYFSIPQLRGRAMHLDDLSEPGLLPQLYKMGLFINDHNFWNGQVEQIYINQKGEAEMVPRVGAHIIILGDLQDFEEKLEKLYSFYKYGLGRTNWNKYEMINLKYTDQIICTKR